MHRFQVLAGSHRTGSVSYSKGDIFESPHELDKRFPNKFQRVQEAAELPDRSGAVQEGEDVRSVRECEVEYAPTEVKAVPKADVTAAVVEVEEDVTANFRRAVAAGVRITKTAAGKYNVYTVRGSSPLNPAPFGAPLLVSKLLAKRIADASKPRHKR